MSPNGDEEFVSRPITPKDSTEIARKLSKLHNSSYLLLLLTSDERAADPGSIAVIHNTEGKKRVHTSNITDFPLYQRNSVV